MEASSGKISDRLSVLVEQHSLGGNYVLLTFAHDEIAQGARAGQFAMLQPEKATDPLLRRPFSIMDTNAQAGTFTIFLKAIGPGSSALAGMKKGEKAHALGPLGRGFSVPLENENAFLCAGGYGVAPFALFAQNIFGQARTVQLFYGGRSASDLPLVAELEKRKYRPVLSTDDGTRGTKGRVSAPLLEALSSTSGPSRIYACGPHPMMHAIADIAADRGVPCEVSLDPWMGCGIGTCLGCVVKIRKPNEAAPKNRPACTYGPVFDATEVVW